MYSDSEPESEDGARYSNSRKQFQRKERATGRGEKNGQIKKPKLGSTGKSSLTTPKNSTISGKKLLSSSVPNRKSQARQMLGTSTGRSCAKSTSAARRHLPAGETPSRCTASKSVGCVPVSRACLSENSLSGSPSFHGRPQGFVPSTQEAESLHANDDPLETESRSISSLLGDISNTLGTVVKKLEKHELKLELMERRLHGSSSDSSTRKKSLPQVVRVCFISIFNFNSCQLLRVFECYSSKLTIWHYKCCFYCTHQLLTRSCPVFACNFEHWFTAQFMASVQYEIVH